MGNPREPFLSNTIYHVYNYGNGDELIFRETENYRFFLERFRKYIKPVAKVYAYCLMPNHFHFLVRIKSVDELFIHFEELYPVFNRSAMSQQDIADLVSKQFKNFLISYSKSFNKMYDRRGSLFLDNIKRIPVTDDDYFTNLIRYIHLNPVLHGFRNSPTEWEFSSYESLISDKRSWIDRQDVLEWFGGVEQFINFHMSIEKEEFEVLDKLKLE